MSAKDQIAAMLDELMGTSRNGESSRHTVKFDDYRVCRAFLLGCCPYVILTSTKADLGSCHKVHDLALKADYEKASQNRRDYNFEYDALSFLENFIADCDRKKEVSKRRLKEIQEDLNQEAARKMAKVSEAEEEIKKKLEVVEEYGSRGDVDESIKLMEEVEDLRAKKNKLEMDYRNFTTGTMYQQQQLKICDICTAHVGVNDSDKRLIDHISGKLHLGFIEIRAKLEELKEKVKELRELRRAARDSEKSKKEPKSGDSSKVANTPPNSEKSPGSKTSTSKSRSRSRSRNRTRTRTRSKTRSRSRSRSTKDGISKSKRKRSRSKSTRSRSRDRRRDRETRRRDSRERKQKRRSRS